MSLQQHYETLLKWIGSCETPPQCDLCEEAIDVFIVKRFGESEDRSIFQLELMDSLGMKRDEIQSKIWHGPIKVS